MKFRFAVLWCIVLASNPLFAAEEVTVAYKYAGNHNTDFSSIRVSLGVGEFSDSRSTDNANLITDEYQAESALSGIVRDAFIQGFVHGGAELVDDGPDMQLVGRINSSEMQIIDRDGVQSIQLTIRTGVQLTGRGRTIWETTLFGRGVVPVSEGIVAAVHGAIDRMIRELVSDDYFLIELQ
ncbi:MAG: hypothetical protein O2971_17015 [Proteobacteria bacterium]|nr:hypothetical protein [Pseudomonadota bacterium]